RSCLSGSVAGDSLTGSRTQVDVLRIDAAAASNDVFAACAEGWGSLRANLADLLHAHHHRCRCCCRAKERADIRDAYERAVRIHRRLRSLDGDLRDGSCLPDLEGVPVA